MDDFTAKCCSHAAGYGDGITVKTQCRDEVHVTVRDRGKSSVMRLSSADTLRLRDWLIAAHPLPAQAPKGDAGHTPTLAQFNALQDRVRALGDLWAGEMKMRSALEDRAMALEDRLATMESPEDPLTQEVEALTRRVRSLEDWRCA